MTARIVVAGTHSGTGKTTVATGLIAALVARGLKVAPFKVGPDFIDPSYHRLAAGRPGRNLDAYLCGPDLIEPLFVHGARGANIAVIEGVMGLFDGAAGTDGFSSTAHVAKLLRAPVVLVVDASSMSTSVAALVRGFAVHDPELSMAGVILNRVGSETHERLLTDAIGHVGLPVLGVLRRHIAASTPSRHLGLVPASERAAQARRGIRALGELVSSGCDLDEIARLASTAPALCASAWDPSPYVVRVPRPARVAVATGPAFTFIYEENLELLRARGAEVSPFDPASDETLPDMADALYIGGGFPETYADALNANAPMRAQVRSFALSGRPVAAECGGLLYLCRSLDGREMCGVLPAEARMTDRLTLGYRCARAASPSVLFDEHALVQTHEFHHSAIEPRFGTRQAWRMDGVGEGFVQGGIHASYLHTHWASRPDIADRFVAAAVTREAAACKPAPLREG